MLRVILIVLCMTVGCSTAPSVCDTVTEPSLLCSIAEEYGIRLEDVGGGFIMVNELAIIGGLYTRDQATIVLKELRDLLDLGGISYAVYRLELYDLVGEYSGLLDVAGGFVSRFANQFQVIYTADRRLLRGWIDGQLVKVRGLPAPRA